MEIDPIIPVKMLLQDLTRNSPFSCIPARSCGILRDFGGILQEFCARFLQDSCKIPQDPQDSARSCKILQGCKKKGPFLVRSCKSVFTGIWLSEHTQSMVVEVHLSKQYQYCQVFLNKFCTGPYKVFIVHQWWLSPTLCLFADDCLLYHKIKSHMTQFHFKKPWPVISLGFSSRWNSIATIKCIVIRCSRSCTSIQHSYIKHLRRHSCLGITLHKSLSWSSCIIKFLQKPHSHSIL